MHLRLALFLTLVQASSAFGGIKSRTNRLPSPIRLRPANVHKSALPIMSKALQLKGGFSNTLDVLLGTGVDRQFNAVFMAILASVAVLRVISKDKSKTSTMEDGAKKLQLKFLPVFWLFRLSDWLQGPYFVEVYQSKIIGGAAMGMDTIAKLFLTGFGTTALLGTTYFFLFFTFLAAPNISSPKVHSLETGLISTEEKKGVSPLPHFMFGRH